MGRQPDVWEGKVIPKTVRFQRNDPGEGSEIVMVVRLHNPPRWEGRKIEVQFDNRLEFVQHIQDCINALAETGYRLPDTLG